MRRCLKPARGQTFTEMAEITGKHRVTIARRLKALREAGIVDRTGSDKDGFWKVIDQ